MSNGEQKSSDDLIREARRRLESPRVDPPADTLADDGGGGGSAAESASSHPSPPPVPDVTSDADEPGGLVYRSQTPETAPTGSVDPSLPDGVDTQQHRPRATGWLVWAASILLLGGGLFLASLGGATRDDTGEIVGEGDVEVLDLRTGDCFNDPDEFEELVFDVAAVPCSEPHDNEVFAVESLAGAFSETFPGFAVLDEFTYEVCSGQLFDSYVGTSYFDSELEVFAFTPSEESWDDGDRGFVCVLYRLDFGKLIGSARDSGL